MPGRSSLALLLLLLVGCDGSSSTPTDASLPDGQLTADASLLPDGPAPDAKPAPYAPGTYDFVANAILLPTSTGTSNAYALDLDGDGQKDNQLGAVLANFAAQGLGSAAAQSAAVADGSIIQLHRLHIAAGGAPVDWTVRAGADHPSPDYSGAGSFTVDSAPPADALPASFAIFTLAAAGPGRAPLELALPDAAPIMLDLVGAHVTADVTLSSCSDGRLGGGIPAAQIDALILPALAKSLNAYIAAHPGDANSTNYLALFDADENGTITGAELAADSLIDALFAPDLDLLDASGAYAPSSDGVKDSLSAGVGFTCVSATVQ